MMKKNGFTLAEVLITLTIIGVVAMMTLPALMTNVQEQQAKTALKKGINTLSEAAQMNMATDGFAYGDCEQDTGTSDRAKIGREQSLRGLLSNRTQVDTLYTVINADGENPPPIVDHIPGNVAGLALKHKVFFRDGAAVYFDPGQAFATEDNRKLEPDGLPHGFNVIYDTNGVKGPNELSTCDGAGADSDKFDEDVENVSEGTADKCDDKKNRQIKDMFILRLRGSSVYPGGAAAKWASER